MTPGNSITEYSCNTRALLFTMLKSLLVTILFQCFLLEINAFSLTRQQERFTCPTVDGFYAIEGECTATYYACVGGVAYSQTCPGTGNVFDPLTKKCVPYADSSCRNTATTTTSSTTTTTTRPTLTSPTTTATTIGPTFNCPTLEGFYPIPNTCGADYYVCVSGSPYVSTCPGDSVFDPASLVCTSPDQASCQKPFVCPTPDGFYPVPGTCGNSYYSCVGGTAYLQHCPGTAIFDPSTNNCVAAENASCKTTTTAPTTPTTTTRPTTTTPTTTTTTTRPTTTTTRPTTTTTTTRPTTTTTTTTTTPTTTKAPFVCPGTGHYPYPGSCTLYYVCSGSNYIVASCPAGQVFNPTTEFCEDPINVPGCYFDPMEYFRDLKFVGMTGGASF